MSGVNPDLVRRLRAQLGEAEAELLVSVLTTLAERVHGILGATLAGVYLNGSFALGAGDIHADVDFLVAVHHGLDAEQETAVRHLHRVLPGQEVHWAHVLEGSYASLDDLQARADPHSSWLYVDNGDRDMEWSTHDNTGVFRWVLHNRALSICGPAPATLIDQVPHLVLRHEAASLAVRRAGDIAADMDYLHNAWGQPHEVLTRCRLLYTATHAEVIGKRDAARWATEVVPAEWHDLINHAVADRPYPTVRVHQAADPMRAERTWQFVLFMAPLIAHAASDDGLHAQA
jgi:Domain of unknown function (DUF4111)